MLLAGVIAQVQSAFLGSHGNAAGTSTAAAIGAALAAAVGSAAGTSTAAASSVAPPSDAWSSSFAPAKFTLSNGNLTATATDHNQIDTLISTVSHSSGKLYCEFTIPGTGQDAHIGFANSDQPNNTVISSTTKSLAARFFGTGDHQWEFNNVGTNSSFTGSLSAGTIIGMAIDLDAKKVWFRNTSSPSTWYGNNSSAGDPVAGTNAFTYAGFASAAVFLAWTSNQNGVDVALTMNAGPSFAASAPSGYSNWNS